MKKILTLLLVATFILTGCSTNEKSANEDNNKLVISTWGLSEDALKETIFKPFEEEFSAEIVTEFGTTSERLTKLKENPAYPIDVIELNQALATEALELGLVDKLTVNEVANMEELIDSAKTVAQEGAGPAYVINSIGIIYNPNGAKKDIKEWADLWDPALKDRIAIPDIVSTFGPALVTLAGDLAGTPISEDDGVAAFKKLEELKPNIVKAYSKSSDLAIMFANGEIDAAIIGDFAYGVIKKANPDLEYVVPASATYANFNIIQVNKNAKNKELAYKYINYRLSQAVQALSAKNLNEAPTNKNVVLDDETSANKTYGDIAQRAKALDYKVINKNMATWIDQFNRLMNR